MLRGALLILAPERMFASMGAVVKAAALLGEALPARPPHDAAGLPMAIHYPLAPIPLRSV